MTLASLRDRLPVTIAAIRAGLARAELPGRLQSISGPVEWILDVAHNPHGAAVLAAHLRERPCAGRTQAVIGLLADKDASGVVRALTGLIDGWHPVMLTGLRGGSGDELARALRDVDAPAPTDVASACQAARTAARPGDRIVVLGSFQTVAPVLAAQPWLSDSPPPQSREA